MTSTRILVVEDEQIVAEDLKMTLESLGYQVAGIVSTGERAIKLADTEKPDLILMDIMLAGKIDGITAASEIRASHDIPVIYVTAYADSTLLDRAKLTTPYGYIVKPFNEREVQSNIEIALFKHRMEHEIKKRDAILLALGFGVEWFLRQFSDTHRITLGDATDTWGYDFHPILEQIAIAMDLDRVQVLRFREAAGRPESLDLISEWTMGATPYHLKGNESPVVALSEIGLSGSMQDLVGGTPVKLHPETLPGSERPLLVQIGVHSAIALPIFVRDRIWGLVLFATGEAREFLGEEIEAMKIAVNIIGGAISLYVSAEGQSRRGPAVQ